MSRWDITGMVIMKKALLFLAVLFLMPFSSAFSQKLGSLKSTADYHYTNYLVGQYAGEGNCQIQFYSNGVTVKFYKLGSSRKAFQSTRTFYYQQRNSNGANVYVEPTKNSYYCTFEIYDNGRGEIVYNDPNSMFSKRSVTYKFTKGIVEKEFSVYNQTPAPAPVNTNQNNNYNNGSYGSNTCSLCNGSGRCCGAGNVAFSNQYCGGTGRCHPCNGTGLMTNVVTGNKTTCTYCGGSGICSRCRGTGSCERCGGTGRH